MELEFESSLSMEDIEHNFSETDFFSGLMEGLEAALEYCQGKPDSGTVIHTVDSQEPALPVSAEA